LYRDAWEVAVNEGSTLHLARGTVNEYRGFYGTQRKFDDLQEQEQAAWVHLSVLEERAGPWPHATTEGIERALANANYTDTLMGRLASNMVEGSQALKLPLVRYFGEPVTGSVIANELRARDICKPLLVGGKPFRAARA
jgi:hypothetical protein